MAGEYRGDVQLESLPVNKWLKDLRMECYRRHLDDYPTVLVSHDTVHCNFIRCAHNEAHFGCCQCTGRSSTAKQNTH